MNVLAAVGTLAAAKIALYTRLTFVQSLDRLPDGE
jgi:hypothetical protein